MPERPFQKLTNRELDGALGRQLAHRTVNEVREEVIEVTAFGDANPSYLVGRKPVLNHNVFSTNATTTSNYITTSNGVTFSDAYWISGDTVKLVRAGQAVEGTAKPETDLEWLRRRVEEICWVPA